MTVPLHVYELARMICRHEEIGDLVSFIRAVSKVLVCDDHATRHDPDDPYECLGGEA